VGNVNSGCTVVMATFNGAKYLGEQLASLEAQVLLPSRLIVSDDGSSDATREVVASFAKKASFDVTIVDGPQQGYAENFWSAAKLADTKYLAWSDQDDVWHPRKIQQCMHALGKTGASFVSHLASVVDEGLRPLGHFAPAYRRTRVLDPLQGDPLEVTCGFASVFRRDLLSEVDWATLPRSHQHARLLPHDHVVKLIAFAFHPRVEIHEPLVSWRQHNSNTAGIRRFALCLSVTNRRP
jgi:glycosyltransferase involved in cell wall biosynthesis